MRFPRLVLGPVLGLVPILVVASCAADDDGAEVATDTTTSTGEVAELTTTSAPTTTVAIGPTTPSPTTAAPTTTPTTAAPAGAGDPTVTCAGDAALTGDLDGDGAEDRAVQVTDPATGDRALEVCLSGAGGGFRVEPGGGGVLTLADLDGDGAAEVLYGDTQATARTVQVVRVVDGRPGVVQGPAGALVLVDGYPEGVPPDGPRHAFGCDDRDGERVLVTVELTAASSAPGAEITGTWTAYALDGARATVVAETPIDDVGGDEVLATMDELAASWAPPC